MMNPRLLTIVAASMGGGVGVVTRQIANHFAQAGREVEIVIWRTPKETIENLSPRVKVVALGTRRAALSLLPLARHLKRTMPQVVLSMGSHLNPLAILATRIARTRSRIVVSDHVHLSTVPANRWSAVLLPLAMRATYGLAQGVVAVSHGVAEDISAVTRLAPGRITVIYNGIDIEEAAANARERESLVTDAVGGEYIVAVGRLTRQKDYPTLIKAFSLIARERKESLVIVGEGRERPAIESLIARLGLAERIVLAGHVANPLPLIKGSRLFVLSSVAEGFAIVLLEAMACGVPIVSTDCASGPSELLENGRWGRLVPIRDARRLSEAMAAALADRRPIHYEQRLAHFTQERMLKAYEEVLGLK